MNFSILAFLLLFNFSTADRILMLIDDLKIRDSHSEFIKILEDRGHTITIKMADDQSLALVKFGEFLFDHLLVFAPSVNEFGGSISVPEISNFIDGGGNVFIAAGSNLGDAIRDLATEVGFEFDEENTAVIDHFNYDSSLDDGTHTTLVVSESQLMNVELITGKKSNLKPMLFNGIAFVTDNSKNSLRIVVATAASTAYSFNPKMPVEEYPVAIGKTTILIAAMQARNNARVVITGSLDFISNNFFNAQINKAGEIGKTPQQKSGNRELAIALSKWVLKETGVLRIKSVKHHTVGQKNPPPEYTIMDNVHYEINLEELRDGKWVPFQGKDVQLEFVRIDPFVRTTLKNNKGRLSADFKVPDVYGVYKFLVDYHRIGYTHLYDVRQVSVRPLKHTQYERFSRCAYPYYVSAFSMMIGVILFSFVFLYYKDSSTVTASTQSATSKLIPQSQAQKKKTT